ncbi:L1 [Francolinus leucoscepus papillomavirus 1]|uniref:Major capsid protein L1 n=1 Tax=Francolinus leucoscepus papillomavirus 1 TaxID=485362 RepID=C6ZDA5_9PAPI|nr:L1 [Francolinus leucoscepus papillomavirus 1]ABX61091.1 L1 [Francolinus leucoscepus papillomavirus 1]
MSAPGVIPAPAVPGAVPGAGGAVLPPALYIPTTTQLPTYYSTDDFVEPTDYVYSCSTDRLLTVGHPYFEIADKDKGGAAVPKVSGNQYRVFRCKLPDPNGQFPLPDGQTFDNEKYRLVWQLIALEVGRGQPLGIGLCAGPLFNRGRDVENPNARTTPEGGEEDNRVNIAMDPKQNQMLIVGCSPAFGEHWTSTTPCPDDTLDTTGPPIELVTTVIEDGDMSDIGFGNMDFVNLARNKSDVPLELVNAVSKYPDWLRMKTDPYGDSCFYCVRREQLYCRHIWQHSGNVGDPLPEKLYPTQTLASTNNLSFISVPSGSVVTSDTQLFNRPYWLAESQGPNNGVCWGDSLFVTVLDNTRSEIFNISTITTGAESTEADTYKRSNYNEYVRHVEEFSLEFLVRLCKVPLQAEVLAHVYRMSPTILDRWGITELPYGHQRQEDRYHFLHNQAHRCLLPASPTPTVPVDPWGSYRFWDVDCTGRLSSDLGLSPLGRRYLALPYPRYPRLKRGASVSTSGAQKTAKRRRR